MTVVAVNVPKLAVALTAGTILEWLVADGSSVTAGQPLYVLETEKVETEIESPCSGVIRLIGAPGETYPVGTCIAEIE